ncbi:MAG: Mov34/MPN/PAD-1 family protein, partial [Candidatus Lokiarchaeota archaeon]|nr:Mov34/MPN/PAD-1 family protein [Candidatus Lokiarchaeota archaeon]
VVIEEILFILGAVHSDKFSTSQIEGTAGKYERRFQKLKKKRENDNLRIVGWWHSHPGFSCFLSHTDLKTQEYFFPESYQVALVVDPHKDELEFFTLDKNSKNGYKPISYAILT